MKIKDLSNDTRLTGIIFIHPKTGERCEWVSAWMAGVWWRKPNSGSVSEVFTISITSLDEALEWEVAP